MKKQYQRNLKMIVNILVSIIVLLLCIFLGVFGGHKFYEGKVGMGVLYLFTVGLFGIGLIVDFITILCRSNPYYV